MRVYELQPHESRYRLQMADRPARPLEDHQVRVQVAACSLNYRDLVNKNNLAGRKVEGRIPLSDGAGTIVEIGKSVARFKVGDRVAGCFFQGWIDGPFSMDYHKNDLGGTIDGMLAEEVVLHEDGLVAIPKSLNFEEVSCLPCAGLTAWYALTNRGQLQPGQSILAIGTGGVSICGLQFAKALGARVFIISSSDSKLARAVEIGADATVNYRANPAWEKEIHRLSDKKGIDHVLEVGGPGTLEKSLACLAPGGHIALIGVLTGFGPPSCSLFPLVAKNARLNGIYVGPRSAFEKMNAFIDLHGIKPVVDRVFSFEEAPAAFDHLEGGSHFGKVVIRVSI